MSNESINQALPSCRATYRPINRDIEDNSICVIGRVGDNYCALVLGGVSAEYGFQELFLSIAESPDLEYIRRIVLAKNNEYANDYLY